MAGKKEFRLYATVTDIRDGDTLTVELDQALGHFQRPIGMRLMWTGTPNGLNAAELDEPGGPEAKEFIETLVSIGQEYPVTSMHWDKYAQRIDGLVTLPGGRDLGTVMVTEGWAVPWDGHLIDGKRPVPDWPRA